MSRQYWSEPINWVTADGVAVNTTATETIIFPDYTVPGGYFFDGRILLLTASGRWSNVVTAVPTITFALRWGGVAGTMLAQSPAITVPAAATTNAIWDLSLKIQQRTNGATGTLFVMGTVSLFTTTGPTFGTVTNYGVVAPMASAGAATPAAVTVDLTAAANLSLTGKWSASNAANAFQGHLMHLMSPN